MIQCIKQNLNPALLRNGNKTLKPLVLSASICLGFPLLACGATHTSARMQHLLDQHQPEQAYRIGHAAVQAQAGQATFDLIFARAAAASQHHAEAIFAYERYLMADPNNTRVKTELLKIFHTVGDVSATARLITELNAVHTQLNIQDARTVERIDLSMRKLAIASHYAPHYSLRFGVGYDSNINQGTDAIFYPTNYSFQTLTVADNARAQHDSFYHAAILGRGGTALSHAIGLYWQGFVSHTNNFSSETFDRNILSLTAGPAWHTDYGQFKLPLTFTKDFLDGQPYASIPLAGIEWTLPVLPTHSVLDVYSQWGDLIYSQAPNNDVRVHILGARLYHHFMHQHTRVLLTGYSGQQSGKGKEPQPDNGYRSRGISLLVENQLAPKHRLEWLAAEDYQRYHYFNTGYDNYRKDHTFKAGLSWLWQPQQDWRLRLGYRYTTNKSSQSIYRYQRKWTVFEVQHTI